MFNIREQLKKLPDKPGVYIMKNSDDEIIYIGKAVNLKNRVKQYFQNKAQTPKVKAMVSKIKEFEYIITDSELEALILECNLIKKFRPKYNILLKDDKHYPYIKITIGEEYPRIMITRKIEKDGAKYYGPYSSSAYVNDTIEVIKKIFPIRTCKSLPKDISKSRPCLNYHINRCLAPCQGEVSKEEYKNMMKDICLFLDGKHNELIKKLEMEMQNSAEKLNFEKAADLRDKINSLKRIAERQKVISTALEDQDVVAFASNDSTVIQTFFIRGGKLIGREKFTLEGTDNTPKEEILSEFLKQFYSTTDYVPREILLQEEIDEANIIESWLTQKRGSKVYIRVPKKGSKHELIDLVYKNALDALESFENQVKDKSHIIELKELQTLLGINSLPTNIEAYDISNIHGSMSVGSMVTFVNGEPDKKLYRRFKIKYVTGQNDYQSIQEILFRRINNKENFGHLPDLICIDGGKGHVNAAVQVLKDNGITIPVCGMVKNDKHKTRGIIYNDKEYALNDKPKLFSLITYIQDEVHRFAINYHRHLRKKELTFSELDNIKGIGEKRKTDLLKYFKSIDNIKKASIDELTKVKSINRLAAEKIYEYFRR